MSVFAPHNRGTRPHTAGLDPFVCSCNSRRRYSRHSSIAFSRAQRFAKGESGDALLLLQHLSWYTSARILPPRHIHPKHLSTKERNLCLYGYHSHLHKRYIIQNKHQPGDEGCIESPFYALAHRGIELHRNILSMNDEISQVRDFATS